MHWDVESKLRLNDKCKTNCVIEWFSEKLIWILYKNKIRKNIFP